MFTQGWLPYRLRWESRTVEKEVPARIAIRATGEGESVVRINGPHGLVDVVVRVELMRGDGLTCSQRGPGSFLAYRPVAAVAVE